ncbi:uncharacterized protein LOC132704727 [Cylas formicarius]|uniref:uncharacterized protein LOC132704727 n=1 Tax=Cylas formicarius TaxID=197179 RepID=UPI002958AC28|nr:uncharacterized protein LOC132704727 [Cylas formicarius]
MVKHNVVSIIWMLYILRCIYGDAQETKLVTTHLEKSKSTSLNAIISSSTDDLEPAAAESYPYRSSRYAHREIDCSSCNQIPWIPITGRKLHFTSPEVVFNSRANIPEHRNFLYPPIDQYGAPQGYYGEPKHGEVAEFMLPPPLFIRKPSSSLNAIKPPVSSFYSKPSTFSKLPNFAFDSLVGPTYQSILYSSPQPRLNLHKLQQIASVNNYRPISSNFRPPPPPYQPHSFPGINHLPLAQTHLPFATPSDSYGKPVQNLNFVQKTQSSHLPTAKPSDSYGNPVTGNHLPYLDTITLASGDDRDYPDIQVVPSVQIADYTASIEHPINLIQSPLLDLIARDEALATQEKSNLADNRKHTLSDSAEASTEFKLHENPIFVKDILASESTINSTTINTKRDNDKFLGTGFAPVSPTIANGDKILQGTATDKYNLAQPSLEYNLISTVMLPPPPSKSTWNSEKLPPAEMKDKWFLNKKYDTLSPTFNPPPITNGKPQWNIFTEQERPQDVSSSTKVYNIKDLLANQSSALYLKHHLPYDVITLQRNIDDWTHQSYAKHINFGDKIRKFKEVKQIPDKYLTTHNYDVDHLAAGSSREESISNEIESNSIDSDESITTTSLPFIRYVPTTENVSQWNTSQVLLSNVTQEKVYIVTPQSKVAVTPTPTTAFSMAPKIQNGKVNMASTMTKISIRVEPQSETRVGNEILTNPIKVVYSEWPHLINNLETTTSTVRPTSSHPLLGLMGLYSYNPPPDSTVETISGHSKVSTVVTPANSHQQGMPSTEEPLIANIEGL